MALAAARRQAWRETDPRTYLRLEREGCLEELQQAAADESLRQMKILREAGNLHEDQIRELVLPETLYRVAGSSDPYEEMDDDMDDSTASLTRRFF